MKLITKIVPVMLFVLPACSDVEKDGTDDHDGHHHDHGGD